jgi:hypothetical protein
MGPQYRTYRAAGPFYEVIIPVIVLIVIVGIVSGLVFGGVLQGRERPKGPGEVPTTAATVLITP